MFKKLVFLLCLSFVSISYGRSYSSGSRSSSPSSSHSYSSGSRSSSRSYSAPSGKSYSSGNKSSVKSSDSKPSFFGKAEKAQAKQDSKASYDKYKASSQSYDYLKHQPKEVYTTRVVRQETVFHNYYNSPRPMVVYHDTSWNPFFWMWLLDHPTRQADWVYNHRSELSDERYHDLLAKNKDLEAQIKALEEKKVAKDPNYSPPEIDKDLMYSDEMVKEAQDTDTSWLWWLILTPIIIGGFGYSIYAIFFKKRRF